ncbi:S41 family peptidase [Candidatus Weimeria sp. HCP3S3_B5]|uniref:S41 family peptidase n=1 Tax=Candidatus Weimeria sp. HCP3S3_B5 TaxID=3438871 RepID=UPI003F8A9CC4
MSDKEKASSSDFKKGILAGAIGVLVFLAALLTGAYLILGKAFDLDFLNIRSIAKVKVISGLIDKYYYKDISDKDKETGVYRGLVGAMDDPYSEYLTSAEYKKMQQETSGKYTGIGISVTKDASSGKVKVVRVFSGSPADRAGLKKGDYIIACDGYIASDMSLSDFTGHIKGRAGSKVNVVYSRSGVRKKVSIRREKLTSQSVWGRMLDKEHGIGYINIAEFNGTTAKEFEKELKSLKGEGMKAVIYDLRENPGGLVDSVTRILDDILPKGTTVCMMDKNGKKTTFSSDDKKQEKLATVVLVSGDTASAAEIFSGAVRDFKYGTLIGTRTFGKGIVQQEFTLGDGSAVKLTVERYFTPDGECIHKKGIKPDIVLKYRYSGDRAGLDDLSDYDFSKDNQVQKGISVLLGKLLYQ